MEDYKYTQCSFNLDNKDSIVYLHTDDSTTNITAADFGGNEELFRHWKNTSDEDYVAERNHMYNISRKDVSFEALKNTEQMSVPSPEEDMIRREDDLQFRSEIKEFLGILSETQRRRLLLRALHGKSQSEIARIEGVGKSRVHKSFAQISKKFDRFLEERRIKGGTVISAERSRIYSRVRNK